MEAAKEKEEKLRVQNKNHSDQLNWYSSSRPDLNEDYRHMDIDDYEDW